MGLLGGNWEFRYLTAYVGVWNVALMGYLVKRAIAIVSEQICQTSQALSVPIIERNIKDLQQLGKAAHGFS